MLERFFKLDENCTDVRTEVIAGVTTFVAMAYILAVNPAILSYAGMDSGAVFGATAIGAFIGTMLMALLSNYPFVLAPGMGLNAFFAFTVCGQMGYPWQLALAAVFIEGILFVLLSLTSVREAIFNSIPVSLKIGVTAGIGLFIIFVGLQIAKVVGGNPATLVSIYNLKLAIVNGTIYSVGMGIVLCIIGILVIGTLMALKVKGSILVGMVITYIITCIFQLLGWYIPNPALGMYSAFPNFTNFGWPNLSSIFMKFDFSQVFTFNFFIIVVTFVFVDIFDTLGILLGVASKADMLDKDGKLPRIQGALLADSIATVAGAVLGTSTVTTYAESSEGVVKGGRTGLSAVVASMLFLLSLLFAPFFLAMPDFCTASALIVVGCMMISGLKKLNFDDLTDSIPAYISAIAMPFFYSISEGISMGVISYTALKLMIGKAKEVTPVIYILTIIFICKYFI